MRLVGVVTSTATGPSCKTCNKLGTRTVFHRYRPETADMLRTCLGDCPDDMEVEVQPGVPLVAKTVADLRALNAWSPYWILIVPYERQRPESVITIELW
jgi:hypothetical protein